MWGGTINSDIKKKWVSALRSGKFKQGRHSLHRKGKYCAMGVLCKIAMEEGVIDEVPSAPYLPLKVYNWAGLGDLSVKADVLNIGTDKVEFHVVDLNDELKLPFWQIANIIEAYIE